MKKLILTLSALAATIGSVSAQVEIGLKVSPSITSLRTDASDHNFNSTSSQLGFGGGLVVDYFFGENYAFSSGLLLTGKGGTIAYTEDHRNGIAVSPYTEEQKISIQYLQIPVTVKLFTNEIAPATRLYFQVGGSLNVPIGTRINGSKFYDNPNVLPTSDPQTTSYSHIYPVDVDALISIGTEYQLGKSTKVFGGISYNRGLVDIDHYFERTRGFKDVTIKNSGFALDLGIKF